MPQIIQGGGDGGSDPHKGVLAWREAKGGGILGLKLQGALMHCVSGIEEKAESLGLCLQQS